MHRSDRLQEAHDLKVLQTALEASRADELSAQNETAQVRDCAYQRGEFPRLRLDLVFWCVPFLAV